MKTLINILSLCFLIIQPVCSAYFRNYQVENGLSNNTVWTVLQDSEGYMWFGTKDGLNRFDGINFKIYRKQKDNISSIGHNFIHCIKEDSRQRLLVGTRSGMYLYNREQDNFKKIVLESDSTEQVNVNDILEDNDGCYWIACHGNGLYKLNRELVVEKRYIADKKENSLPINYIWTIITDHYGNLWLGSAGRGLIHFDKKNEIFTSITHIKGLDSDTQSVYSLYCDNHNTLWIGTYTNGLFKYNYITGHTAHYLKNTGSVKSIMAYSEEKLIMGSEKGLILFDKEEESYKVVWGDKAENSLMDNSIFSITRDSEGSFWIGTYFSGVNYFSPSVNNFLYFNNLLQHGSQRSIVSSMQEAPDKNILLSTHNNHIIYSFNPTDKRIEKLFEMEHPNIQCIIRDGDSLYVSIYSRGVYVLSVSQKKIIERIDVNTIEGKSMFKISNGDIIFLLEEGGCAYRKPGEEIKRLEKFPRIPIVRIAEDALGNLWFVTHAYGLFSIRLNELHDAPVITDYNKYILNQSLSCIYCDKENRIWIGTKGKGVLLFDPETGRIERTFDETDGLPSSIIYSILKDQDDNFWVATRKGIARIDGYTFTVKTFAYMSKEIQYNPFCELKSSTGQLYFGGVNGFISLDPDYLVTNERVPKVVLTGFRISNRDILPGDSASVFQTAVDRASKIVLRHDQSNFSFDFASLSYVFPESNQYAYMLEGFDKEWNYVTTPTAQYMNIPPGKYVFRVKGTNNDGVWSREDKNMVVRITPPVWQETYMIVLYAVGLIVILVLFGRKSLRYVEKKNKEKQYKYQLVKEREAYESKISFFTNIAHEIRTPLSLIAAPLENIIRTNEGSEQTKRNLLTIERNTNRLLELINQLLDFRKIENESFMLNIRYQNILCVIQKVYDQYCQDVKYLNMEMCMEVPESTILGFVDSEALYKIVSNLVSNAIKFTKNRITLKVESDEEKLFLSVEDNGKGIKSDYQAKIFEPFYQVQVSETDNYTNKGSGLGLSLAQSLAIKLGGKITVQSEYGKGSKFVLELPIIKNKEKEGKENRLSETAHVNSLSETARPVVLIVEDNEELRNFMKDCLSENYLIEEASNGLQALEKLEASMIDIIISDILMPKMNGLELCYKVKSNPAYSHLPFILLSAKTDAPTKIEGLKKGADVYMEKPFSVEQLKAQIASVVENRANIRNNFIQSPLQYFKHHREDSKESADFVNKLNAFILQNMSDEHFSIDNLSIEFAVSRTNFQKKIKNITGLTPNEYIKLVRLNKSAELLASGRYRINEVCLLVGFNSPSYFSKCFYEHFGKLPKDFVQNK